MLTGQNGILNRAAEAKEKTGVAQEEESQKLQGYEDTINQYVPSSNGGGSLPTGEGTTPYLPDNTFTKKEGDLNTGLVIQDTDGNEYVWVEVPTTIYDNTTYNSDGTKKPTNAEDYNNIEICLKAYTSDYKSSRYSDTNPNFTTQYQDMLKSVYENGGFWIGRYEAGLEETKSPRTEYAKITSDDRAVTKPDMYPYNYVKRDEAQTLAQKMGYEDCTSSLIFGVQWDLILKYIETKGATTVKNLTGNSSEVGNYYGSEFTINRGKFAHCDNVSNWYKFNSEDLPDLVANGKKKIQSSYSNAILLTTGATEATSLQKIYDLAGNMWEWTLEYVEPNVSCIARGGSCGNHGVESPANARSFFATDTYFNIGFRIGLWK